MAKDSLLEDLPKDPNELHDEATGEVLERPFIILKDELGDNHHFKDWDSVALWAQSQGVSSELPDRH